jgi:hypothetical protein
LIDDNSRVVDDVRTCETQASDGPTDPVAEIRNQWSFNAELIRRGGPWPLP